MLPRDWTVPELDREIPRGDMPGDKVTFNEDSLNKTGKIFPIIYSEVEKLLSKNSKCVISVCGGSGVGKTTIASLITYCFNDLGIGAYTLSGDNYPRRYPKDNDAERIKRYEAGGIEALTAYLGTDEEIDYDAINKVLWNFKNGDNEIELRRMACDNPVPWYEKKDFSDISVLIIEWTHGNSDFLKGVDLTVYLRSTPEETLAFRKARNRNANTDSPFVAMVLDIEQKKLEAQAHKAKIILRRDGTVSCRNICNSNAPMLNAYPDSMGGRLSDIVGLLESDKMKDCFSSFYILPSLYHSDLDRGFSVIDYDINEELAAREDLERLKANGINLKLDFILNHASTQSLEFKNLLENGEASPYKDFFIDWNKFWDGYGELTDEGYIKPKEEYIKDMFFRKPGLPILTIPFPDGSRHPYWNTFYQEVKEDKETGKTSYLGQMDLNIKSPLVWEFYEKTLDKLSSYGASIVRLDAFAYAPKEPGARNFLNDPGTWELLDKVSRLAEERNLKLLPEIHASYEEKIYKIISEKGYMVYDFFLPGLLLYSIENHDGKYIYNWIKEIIEDDIKTVNMLGCHDGIPLLDLKGILDDNKIQKLIELVVSRGGYVKKLDGKKNMYYQVNATYYSALGEDDKKMLFARALQLFMPGKPQIWYLDVFAGKNDIEAVKRAGEGGHKEINRTNLSVKDIEDSCKKDVVRKQLELIRFRNTHPAFLDGAVVSAKLQGSVLCIEWSNNNSKAVLLADFDNYEYDISV